ncbi:fatty acid hydroxylase [Amylibacter ulvae]|uniref:Fatty acid hydroxylase n=1 Tax=Paramylibacter ulvae TaxID=1651968 RepID=A0ABQ3D5F2_9RHOB|nr:fatty acid hydroxylase [Amylibacter ulvae]
MDNLTFPDTVQLAVPFFILAIVLELTWITIKRRGGRYETRDAMTSVLLGAGNVVTGILLGFVAWGFYNWVWQFRFFDLGTSIPIIFICFLLDDLRYYWVHRFGHTIRWAWASHVVHHSSQHYNLTTALRQTWTGEFTGLMIVSVPLLLLGFHPAMVLFVGGINLIYQFWIHTEAITKMPRWFEAVMNTPSHHRVHHGRNAQYLDANYAGVLIIWDKMFGTFVPEGEKVDYGLVVNLGTFNPIRAAFHEWIGIFKDITQPNISMSDRFRYAFAPPGWSHDGSRDTSRIIKRKYVERNPEAKGKPGL